jgi:hypothetical protein
MSRPSRRPSYANTGSKEIDEIDEALRTRPRARVTLGSLQVTCSRVGIGLRRPRPPGRAAPVRRQRQLRKTENAAVNNPMCQMETTREMNRMSTPSRSSTQFKCDAVPEQEARADKPVQL